jgi:hypothetical protein
MQRVRHKLSAILAITHLFGYTIERIDGIEGIAINVQTLLLLLRLFLLSIGERNTTI